MFFTPFNYFHTSSLRRINSEKLTEYISNYDYKKTPKIEIIQENILKGDNIWSSEKNYIYLCHTYKVDFIHLSQFWLMQNQM